MISATLKRILLAAALAASAHAAHAGLDLNQRRAILQRAADLLETRYVDVTKGAQLARDLRQDARLDRFGGIADERAFALALTKRLRDLSADGHLAVTVSEKSLDDAAAETAFSAAEFDRWYGPKVNHGFEKIERLPGNIGLLDLRVFAPPAMAGDVAAAAMTVLAQSDALIIDLRKNGGGDGAMSNLLAAYLFDTPARPMSGGYDRPTDTTTTATSLAWAPGRRFGGVKPVYLLISKKTFSAAEAFAYDLQALKRVTVVGEASGGGAHPFEFRTIGEKMVLSLPEGRSINPITRSDWEGRGVQPDVPCPPGDALTIALRLAAAALAEQKP